MPATLQETMLAPDTEPQVIDDCYALLKQQVSDGSGFSGSAVKFAYKTVNTVFPGHIRHMVESLLPEMVSELEPYWADFYACGDSDFGAYLATRGEEVSEALLTVTDKRGAASGRPTVVKAYAKVRPSAGKHVTAALPQVGALVQKYAR
jgi:hypothetical protein